MSFKGWIKKALSNCGYEVRRAPRKTDRDGASRWKHGVTYWDVDYIKRLGFTPETVFDVGVGMGTHNLYRAFPDAHHILIDPLVEHEPHMREVLRHYQGRYFLTAVGDQRGSLTLNVEPVLLERSSIYNRTPLELTGDALSRREITVMTLDALLDEHEFRPPLGLKIDTEGVEYQVVQGATKFLRDTQFVIAEVSVAERFEGGYTFAEFIGLMDENGFGVCDILEIGRAESTSDAEVTFMDLVFKRKRPMP